MSGSKAFLDAVIARRSFYGLTNKSTISNEALLDIVQKAIHHGPTSFNMQSTRAVLLVGAKHQELWDAVSAAYIKTVGDDETRKTEAAQRFAGFKSGYGTVAFFNDDVILDGWKSKMPAYAKGFQDWAEHSAGISQYIVWTALEAEGLGANLQHYGSFCPEEIAKILEIPSTWRSTAILPFGVPSGGPGKPGQEKAFAPIEDKVKAFF